MKADRVPASLTPARGYVGVRCETCNAPPGRQCWNRDMGQSGAHAKRREHAEVAAWWHCFGDVDAGLALEAASDAPGGPLAAQEVTGG